MTPSRDITRLLEIMAALRTPGTGCPWDLEQNFATIAPYTLEEAYEVADAIARGDLDDLREELGDLLLQVVFHARMAQEQGAFDFGDVVQTHHREADAPASACVRRARGLTPEAVKGLWERIKSRGEGAGKASARGRGRAGLRARRRPGRAPCPDARAQAAGESRQGRLRLERSAGGAGKNPRGSRTRSKRDLAAGNAHAAAAEVGDLLFAVVNLARHLDADPEAVLRATNQKFERRFAAIERALAARGKTPQQATLAEMDALWDEAKAAEKTRNGTVPQWSGTVAAAALPPALQSFAAPERQHVDPATAHSLELMRRSHLRGHRELPLAAQQWPTRTMRIVTGTPGRRQPGFRQPAAGRQAHRAARPGGRGGELRVERRRGVEQRRQSAARRLRIGMLTGAFSARAAVAKSLPYDPIKDFAFVTHGVRLSDGGGDRAELADQDVRRPLARAKAAPDT